MKATTEKQQYNAPEITRLQIDNEISLVMVSGDGFPDDPTEPGMTGAGWNSSDPIDPFFE